MKNFLFSWFHMRPQDQKYTGYHVFYIGRQGAGPLCWSFYEMRKLLLSALFTSVSVIDKKRLNRMMKSSLNPGDFFGESCQSGNGEEQKLQRLLQINKEEGITFRKKNADVQTIQRSSYSNVNKNNENISFTTNRVIAN